MSFVVAQRQAGIFVNIFVGASFRGLRGGALKLERGSGDNQQTDRGSGPYARTEELREVQPAGARRRGPDDAFRFQLRAKRGPHPCGRLDFGRNCNPRDGRAPLPARAQNPLARGPLPLLYTAWPFTPQHAASEASSARPRIGPCDVSAFVPCTPEFCLL